MLRRLLFAAAWTVSAGFAGAVPVLSKLSPGPVDYAYSVDFSVMPGSGVGDVTAALFAVDLFVPSTGGSTSGCEASDFAGFVVGNIALIQRGTCTFAEKVLNAEAAGAAGVLIFNEGNTADRTGLLNGTLLPSSATTMVFGTSFAVGDALRNGLTSGRTGVTVRMNLTAEDLAAVPEPATLALVGAALLGVACIRRRKPAGSAG